MKNLRAAGADAAGTASQSVDGQAKSLGGQVLMARKAPYRADVGLIIDYLASELDILGVKISINSLVDEEMIAELQPDDIVLATGGTPRKDFQVGLATAVVVFSM